MHPNRESSHAVQDLADAGLTDLLTRLSAEGSRCEAMRGPNRANGQALSVGAGACGIAHMLLQTGRPCPVEMLASIHDCIAAATRCPPGLIDGLAGIGWTLWDLGMTDEATALIARAFAHPRLFDEPGLFEGASGVGLAALAMHERTGERLYLDRAQHLASRLAEIAEERGLGVCWRSTSGRSSVGYGHGASGVAAFLLYLYLKTGQWRWLSLGRHALAFDLAALARSSACADHCAASDFTTLEYGSAGVAAVLVRYYAVLGLEDHGVALRAWLGAPLPPATVGPALFRGLAGIGQVCLDCAVLCRNASAERRAWQVARAIGALAQGNDGAVACRAPEAGDVNSDLATGAPGIALFLHRLVSRGTSSFMLDDLLDPGQLQALPSAARTLDLRRAGVEPDLAPSPT